MKQLPSLPFFARMASVGLGLLLVLAVSTRADEAAPRKVGHEATKEAKRSRHGAWRRQETGNFQIWTPAAQPAAEKLAESCERLLEKLSAQWTSGTEVGSWSPKCVVVLHGSLAAYQQAIGSPRDRSVGMATYSIEKGQIVARRIDLRSDAAGWTDDALPHELTHLVLADAFKAKPLPPWIGEGLAVLSESREKQARRAAELERALASRASMPAPELLALSGIPAAARRDVFYSQSASVAAFLLARGGAAKLRDFVLAHEEHGPERSLRQVYGIGGLAQLEQLWLADALASE